MTADLTDAVPVWDDAVPVWDSIVVGAGQAGLSTSYHLQRRGVAHVVFDANPRPGGAWQHRSHSLTMRDVHGVADLPDAPPHAAGDDLDRPAREVVPASFAAYERTFALPVLRPVRVSRVDRTGDDDGFTVTADDGRTWATRTLVSATGTWERPFVPAWPGAADFAGTQRHTSAYDGPEAYAGHRVLVVGGGASAVQVLGELAHVLPAADLRWVTRTPPRWGAPPGVRGGDAEHAFDGRAAVARVDARVRAGLPPESVVSVTGLHLRPQEERARRAGVYASRLPPPARLVADGAVWPDGTHRAFDVVLWATGFRPALGHLAPLRLRGPGGGLVVEATTVAADPRVQLVGYGPSASTIGANRAGRAAALGVLAALGRRRVPARS